MRHLLKTIDTISEKTGSATRWLVVALVAILTFEVVMRYAFDAPTSWAHLSSMMTSGAIVVLGLAYTQLHHGHIRIDIFYAKMSRRGKALVDTLCTMFLLGPLLTAFIYVSGQWMISSWAEGEIRTESYWYPPAGPFRTVFFIGFCLLALQVLAQFIRDAYFLLKGEAYD